MKSQWPVCNMYTSHETLKRFPLLNYHRTISSDSFPLQETVPPIEVHVCQCSKMLENSVLFFKLFLKNTTIMQLSLCKEFGVKHLSFYLLQLTMILLTKSIVIRKCNDSLSHYRWTNTHSNRFLSYLSCSIAMFVWPFVCSGWPQQCPSQSEQIATVILAHSTGRRWHINVITIC